MQFNKNRQMEAQEIVCQEMFEEVKKLEGSISMYEQQLIDLAQRACHLDRQSASYLALKKEAVQIQASKSRLELHVYHLRDRLFLLKDSAMVTSLSGNITSNIHWDRIVKTFNRYVRHLTKDRQNVTRAIQAQDRGYNILKTIFETNDGLSQVTSDFDDAVNKQEALQAAGIDLPQSPPIHS